MTPDPMDVERLLYGADLDEFVRERSAAVKELRGQGKRAEAAAVAKLPKPSVAAWIVNRVSRDSPEVVGELLDAGARLREVQLGAGSAADLRVAADDQEAALRAVMRRAEKVAAARGPAAAGTLDRVRETLHAAALDADLAEDVRRGVLVREKRAVGFPAGIAIPAERRRAAPATRAPAKAAPTPTGPKAASQQQDEVAAKRAETAARSAQEELAGAEADRAAANEALAAAAEELAAARRAVAELSQRVDAERRRAERAEKAHARATKLAAQALDRLRELRP